VSGASICDNVIGHGSESLWEVASVPADKEEDSRFTLPLVVVVKCRVLRDDEMASDSVLMERRHVALLDLDFDLSWGR